MIKEKIKRGLDSRYYFPIITFLVFVFWFVPYLLQQRWEITGTIVDVLEGIGLFIISTIALLILVLFEKTFYAIPIITLVPFMFSHPFDVYTSPICLYISLGLFALGLIIHFILYKTKLKFGHFLSGLLILGLGIILGGINIKNDNKLIQLLIVISCVGGFAILYLFLSSTINIEFNDLARLMTYLGILLVLQSIMYCFVQPEGLISAFTKNLSVGWGISNNVALIILLTSPFTLYLALNNQGKKCVIYLIITLIQFITIVLTYSRGAILSLFVGFCFMLPISIIKANDRKTVVRTIVVAAIIMLISGLLFAIIFKDLTSKFFESLFGIDFNNLNGRSEIYENAIAIIKKYPIFGRGMLSNFNESGDYVWGHSTYLQTAMTMGIVGVIFLSFHMVQKYFYLAKNANLWKIMTIFGLAMSDLYGLFDVSYYFVNYMIVLIVVLVSIDNLINEPLFLCKKITNNKY